MGTVSSTQVEDKNKQAVEVAVGVEAVDEVSMGLRKSEMKGSRSIQANCEMEGLSSMQTMEGLNSIQTMEGLTSIQKETGREKDPDTKTETGKEEGTEKDEGTEKESDTETERNSSSMEAAAAVKVQKVYRSYRTRRNLADCAVVAEELWWQAIEYATLQQNTELFFEVEKAETAVTRWSRARVKASKVGKGLSKDEKARQLALQHWLEAIDPRHRYGHNLHYYYDHWFEKKTSQPFFFWLDVGDGRNLSLEDCPRQTLQKQRIKYLGPKEREQYEVIIKNGKLVYKNGEQLVDTPEGSKWIFVMSPSKNIYVSKKMKGIFQHSSFLAGGAISAAGRLVANNGFLKSVSPYSGHYLPTEENLDRFTSFLRENGVDITNVEISSYEEQSSELENNSRNWSGVNLQECMEKQFPCEKNDENGLQGAYVGSNGSHKENKNASQLHIDVENNATDAKTNICFILHNFVDPIVKADANKHKQIQGSPKSSGAEGKEEMAKIQDPQESQENVYYKRSLSSKEIETQLTEIPQKALLERLHSNKSSKSFQLGKRLSCKWSTGAGPRIGCIADYPSELRFQALQQVNLSPRAMPLTSP